MDAKPEVLMRLQEIVSEHLVIQREEVTENSSWTQLGADSMDRLMMSMTLEDAFKVEIPHSVGERLNTVGETVDHLLKQTAVRKQPCTVQVEAATTNQQWTEILGIRTQVFTIECGVSFEALPGPGGEGVWHFLARDQRDVVGTLSVVDTTKDRLLQQRYRLAIGKEDRVARYTQLAILKPYRKCGLSQMLIEFAQRSVVRPKGFTVEWLLYPAAHTHSSLLTQRLGFIAGAPLLKAEFGSCQALIRRAASLTQGSVA